MQKDNSKSDFQLALKILKPFAKKNIKMAHWQLSSTLIFLWGSVALSAFAYSYNPYYCLAFIPVTTIFLCRSYIIEHDCGHQSFYRKKHWNALAGHLTGFPIMIPYTMWKYIHDSHHNHVGNLDKRDINPEMWTMTVDEFNTASKIKRFFYQIFRSRFTRFIIAPLLIFGILFRIPFNKFDAASKMTVLIYDVLYAGLFYLLFINFSFTSLALIFFIPLLFFFTIASYVLYAQHQYEDTYWEKDEDWTYEAATFKGSTFLTAPKWFNWVSGNVVYHNVHHLISGIPNYNLKKAQDALGNTLVFEPISIFKVWGLFKYKLWDEKKKKLVPIKSVS